MFHGFFCPALIFFLFLPLSLLCGQRDAGCGVVQVLDQVEVRRFCFQGCCLFCGFWDHLSLFNAVEHRSYCRKNERRSSLLAYTYATFVFVQYYTVVVFTCFGVFGSPIASATLDDLEGRDGAWTITDPSSQAGR